MDITFSCKNIPRDGHHGRVDHMIWMHRENGSARVLGVARYTTYRKWCAELDNLRGGIAFFESDKLQDLRRDVKIFYAV